MRITEIMENYIPVYPEQRNWAATVDFMLNDPIEKAIVDDLLAVLRAGKTFRESIYLGMGHWDDEEKIPAVLDGTHRVVALILHNDLNHEAAVEIETENDETDEDISLTEPENGEPEIYAITEVRFTRPLTEDEHDTLFSVIRSMKINDDLWVVSDMMSSSRNIEFTNSWNLKPEFLTTDMLARIHGTITYRLNGGIKLPLTLPPVKEISSYWEEWTTSTDETRKLRPIVTRF